jgi:hypothetical protein
MIITLNFIFIAIFFSCFSVSFRLSFKKSTLSHCSKQFSYFPSIITQYARNYNRDFNEDDSGIALDDFDSIVESLILFKKLFKDTRVPLKFEVPAENPWPYHLHGLRLGKRLEKILSKQEFFEYHKDKVEILKNLGFEPKVESLAEEWDILWEALQTYYRIYGNLRVAVKFIVPDEEPWPRLCRGCKLGTRVASIRSAGRFVKDHPERKAMLDRLGFEWRIRDHTHKQQVEEDNFDRVVEALRVYKEIIDDDLDSMPIDFVVPQSEEWPENVWDLKLGVHLQSIREKDKLFFNEEDKAKKLEELGIEKSDAKSDRTNYTNKRFELVYDALETYKSIYGDLMVPQSFSVPASPPWPEHTWTLKL